jgi:hypothetical protein
VTNIVCSEPAEKNCPSCESVFLLWRFTFRKGTNLSLIDTWSFEKKLDKCVQLEEYCHSCKYTNVR